MKNILFLIMLLSSLYGETIQQPVAQFKSAGGVIDLVYAEGKLYSATNASCVDIFDIKTKQLIDTIKVDKITDFMGDVINSKVYSVDVYHNAVLLLSQAQKGYRRVHIHKANKTELIIPDTDKLLIAKAKFLDENTLLLALLGNELISYDIKNKKQNYKIQISQSKFSSFALNEDKTQVVIADESGDLKIHNTKDGAFVKLLKGQNLDNVFQVDYKNNMIATAGQDRRIVIYDTRFNTAYYKTAQFLIYSVGLSASGKRVAYSSDENNNVTVFNTNTQSILGVFGENYMTLSNILFINENEFLVSSDDKIINLYKIK
ncbi:WD40 repeat domain-containing protein [bacterium]|nr:WD40 repeat domain-containing protein [bacterium]MBU1994701.1 WD40 repeat domain-containing protein [bacterium]